MSNAALNARSDTILNARREPRESRKRGLRSVVGRHYRRRRCCVSFISCSADAGQAASSEGSSAAYFTEMLFRTDRPDTSGDPGAARAEVGRILATDALSGEMPAPDTTYVMQVIAARTGLSQADAEKRVSLSSRRKTPRIRRSRWRKPQPKARARLASTWRCGRSYRC